MKAVVLFGSPRKNGNTSVLVDVFARTLRAKQHEVKILSLNDLNIHPCQGCFACKEKGECRVNDDMTGVKEDMLAADVLVYATPIYWFGPSGQLKLSMDRSLVFLDADYRSRLQGKKAVSLITCADESREVCQPTLDMFQKTFDLLGMTYAAAVEAVGCEDKGKVDPAAMEAAKKAAESVL